MALHIITGPPGSGKTTFVAEHAAPGDIRVDLDHLANLLAGLDIENHEHDPTVWVVAKAARMAAIDTALRHTDTHDVWIIDSIPGVKAQEKYEAHDAHFHLIDPGKDIVMSRCKAERPSGTTKVAGIWYSKNKSSPPRPAVTQSQPRTSGLIIKSFAYGKAKPRGLVLDARELPNPYDVPGLAIPDGTSNRVRAWFAQQPEMADFIDRAIRRIEAGNPQQVWIGCSAGKHRSVYIADELADHFGIEAEHTALNRPARKGTTERGYGWDHQQVRAKLVRRHRDGTRCWWCGLPMYKDKAKNWDGKALAADHPEAEGARNGTEAKQLLHGNCNSQAQGHENDHRRPAVTGLHPSEPLPDDSNWEESVQGLNLSGISFD